MVRLTREAWTARAADHRRRLSPYVEEHLARRRRGERHPVHDFLFDYYAHRPSALLRWHPGYAVTLLDAPEYADLPGYVAAPDGSVTLSAHLLERRLPLIASLHRLLVETEKRPAMLGCFGLHEWAMVYRADDVRHPWPLRLGSAGTDAVVEGHRLACSHFDAYRFFTPSARPRNAVTPGADDRARFEQPGCLHAGMDLYKHAFRLSPLVLGEVVADSFEVAWAIRELDMRASPYDLSALGFAPVRIETAEGKRRYVEEQRRVAERAAPIRRRLAELCGVLLEKARAEAR